jgi:hypothetical protein
LRLRATHHAWRTKGKRPKEDACQIQRLAGSHQHTENLDIDGKLLYAAHVRYGNRP